MDVQDFLRQLESDDEDDRAFAADDLGAGHFSQAVEALASRLEREPSRRVREAIVNALTELCDESVCRRIAAFLSSDDVFLRASAVSILQRGKVMAIPIIEEALDAPNISVRKLALDALTGIESPDAARLVARALGDEDINVRITAVEYVGEHQSAPNREHVEGIFLAESDPMLHSAAFCALLAINNSESWCAILRRHPSLSHVSPHERGLWLRAAGLWASVEELGCFLDASHLANHAFEDLAEALETFCGRHGLLKLPQPLLLGLFELYRKQTLSSVKCRLLMFFASLRESEGVEAFLCAEVNSPNKMVRRGALEALVRLVPGRFLEAEEVRLIAQVEDALPMSSDREGRPS